MQVKKEQDIGDNLLQQLIMKNRCYEEIYAMSYAYPFRLEIQEKTIHFIGPIPKNSILKETMNHYPEEILESGMIYEEDIDVFKQIVKSMYCGESTNEVFRIQEKNTGLIWYRVIYNVYRDKTGELTEVIGEFIPIQEQKELESRLELDELTGCLNKTGFQLRATEIIKNSSPMECNILLIIDLDNFKAINDNLGHPFGDSVLRETGRKLKEIFRSTDCVGRIGGDEFMVFLRAVKDMTVIENRIRQVVKSLDRSYEGKVQVYRTTASIGIAIQNQDGIDYETLYKCADIALYDVKLRGKNDYSYYNSNMEDGCMNNTTPFDVARMALERHFDPDIVADVFSMLSESKEHDISINQVLYLLALRFKAERCYIFEFDEEDPKYLNNTYEWCAPGISAEIDNLQKLPKEAYQPLFDRANSDGIFYCNDMGVFEGESTFEVMQNQGIRACLISCNKKHENVTSIIGFDDCTKPRIWTSIEISTLLHVGKIMNQFLEYAKASRNMKKAEKEKLNVLDTLYSYAYIIDENTHELQYYNQEFKKQFPDVEIGDLCYKVLHGKNESCSDCPMVKMQHQGKAQYRTIMPIQKLNRDVLVEASVIGGFEGKPCIFFSCSDIGELDD